MAESTSAGPQPRSRFAEALRPLARRPYRLILQQANSLLGLPQSFFGIGGPAAGGVLIAVFGTGWLFAPDAATFFVSLVCLALLRVPARAMPPPAPFLADLGEGWHELAIRPWYWITLCAHACGNFTLPAFFVLGPVIAARSLGGASAWGFISAGWGVGAIAGGLVALRVKPRRPLIVATLLTTLIALPPLALAFSCARGSTPTTCSSRSSSCRWAT